MWPGKRTCSLPPLHLQLFHLLTLLPYLTETMLNLISWKIPICSRFLLICHPKYKISPGPWLIPLKLTDLALKICTGNAKVPTRTTPQLPSETKVGIIQECRSWMDRVGRVGRMGNCPLKLTDSALKICAGNAKNITAFRNQCMNYAVV